MNILSFDIEDWFHILDNSTTKTQQEWKRFDSRIDLGVGQLLELLAELDIKATFFCLGWIAEHHPHVVRRIIDAGHQIGSHSYAHQLAYLQDEKEFSRDLVRSIKILEDISGKGVKFYRAPGFSVTKHNTWVFECLVENGIEVDCSVFPAPRAHGGFPEFGKDEPVLIETNAGMLLEFPMNVVPLFGRNVVFSGGGYFRLFPYWFIRKMMNKSEYVMTYFHPRDFDKDQPIVPGLSLFRRFKSYYGLSSSMDKLVKLLSEYEFISLSEAVNNIDHKAVRTMTLK